MPAREIGKHHKEFRKLASWKRKMQCLNILLILHGLSSLTREYLLGNQVNKGKKKLDVPLRSWNKIVLPNEVYKKT